jgi:glycosyltransferase involved in cell wall biosynthesis
LTIKVAALTSGREVPSSRFRVRQHIRLLRQYGIDVREYIPAISKFGPPPGWPQRLNPWWGLPFYAAWQGVKLSVRLPGISATWKSQVTWLERELLAGIYTLEGLIRKPLVFDVDDAVWLFFPFSGGMLRQIARRSDVIVAGNSFLADWFSQYCSSIRIIPTAIDAHRFRPAPKPDGMNGKFVIGWTGGDFNLPYLYAIEAPLRRLFDRYPEMELLVVCNRPPRFVSLPASRVRYLPWSEDIEAQAVQQMDVGLMPLPDTDWARGKCSFKMLQYMSCGIPAVVSPVGMNRDVLAMGDVGLAASTGSEWESILEKLYLNSEFSRRLGRNGRRIILECFDRKVIVKQLTDVFIGLI